MVSLLGVWKPLATGAAIGAAVATLSTTVIATKLCNGRIAEINLSVAQQESRALQVALEAEWKLQADARVRAKAAQEIDERHTREMNDARKENAALASRLATAQQRLSVRVATPPTGTDRVPDGGGTAGRPDDAGARAELHPTTAAGLVRVTGRADECRGRLTSLQEWALSLNLTSE